MAMTALVLEMLGVRLVVGLMWIVILQIAIVMNLVIIPGIAETSSFKSLVLVSQTVFARFQSAALQSEREPIPTDESVSGDSGDGRPASGKIETRKNREVPPSNPSFSL